MTKDLIVSGKIGSSSYEQKGYFADLCLRKPVIKVNGTLGQKVRMRSE